MDWSDEAVVLAARRHGEGHAVLDCLTRGHGRARGYVRGAHGRALRGVLEPGNEVMVTWRARLETQLGHFQVELKTARAGQLLADKVALATLSAATTLMALAMPEREALPGAYHALLALMDLLAADVLPEAAAAGLVQVELGLLAALGYGLDLSRCAATGATDDLIYVSPKSARAVSASAGAPYADKLLPLPGFLLGRQAGPVTAQTARQGLALTGYFLDRWVLAPTMKTLPPDRQRLLELLDRD
ncbi:MAG: DNA repair protein RecO [Rhodothalassiaceae bacterium]